MEQVRSGRGGLLVLGRPEDTGTHRLGLVRMGGLLVLSHLRINWHRSEIYTGREVVIIDRLV